MAYTIYFILKPEAIDHIEENMWELPLLYEVFLPDYMRKILEDGNVWGWTKPRNNISYENRLFFELKLMSLKGWLVNLSDDWDERVPLEDKVPPQLRKYLDARK
jgi:hypothetical protein